MSSFVPSQVMAHFPSSVFQNGEKECVAAFTIAYLTANGDVWVMDGKKFLHYMLQWKEDGLPQPNIHPAMLGMAELYRDALVNTLLLLTSEGYFERTIVGEEVTFTVMDKMKEFYRTYVR